MDDTKRIGLILNMKGVNEATRRALDSFLLYPDKENKERLLRLLDSYEVLHNNVYDWPCSEEELGEDSLT